VDKPKDMTSHDVVDAIRMVIHQQKVGHTGTLDPLATGVLPLCVGKATRVAQYLIAVDKEYVVEMKLGLMTDTQDITGVTLQENSFEGITESRIKGLEKVFSGEFEQIPPMVSAKHHKGKRLYELAREGEVVEREPVLVRIDELEITGINLPIVKFRVATSKGTYIRTLCNDMGENLGCGAAMSGLIRTRCGSFSIENSVPLKDLTTRQKVGENIVPIGEALGFYSAVYISDEEIPKILNGIPVSGGGIIQNEGKFEAGDFVRVFSMKKKLLAIAKATLKSDAVGRLGGDLAVLRPVKVFQS
jgi:tRNA pseudouridine55 synthase